MTRGKYAAKANGQRAQVAQNVASVLRAQIDEMRREHLAEVAALNTRIAALEGQLLREVRDLAALEVKRVRSEAAAALEFERTQNRDRLMEITARLAAWDRGPRSTAELADLLGVKVGALAGDNASRDARRTASKHARAAAAQNGAWFNPGGEVRLAVEDAQS